VKRKVRPPNGTARPRRAGRLHVSALAPEQRQLGRQEGFAPGAEDTTPSKETQPGPGALWIGARPPTPVGRVVKAGPATRDAGRLRAGTHSSRARARTHVTDRGVQLGQPVELEQKVAELVETFRSELPSPGGFDLADGLSDHAHHGYAAWSERDALGAKVVGIHSTLEIAEAFELAEEVVQGLLADP